MDNEKLQVVLSENQKELIIREGKAQNILDAKPPVKINLIGTIGAPFEFLEKRLPVIDDNGTMQIDIRKTHIKINRELVSITLIANEDNEYISGTVVGLLEQHPKFKEFGVNSNKAWEANELGQFLKMNRAFFPDKAKNMKLVADLKNFQAKVDTTIEQQKEDKGSFKDNYSGVVTSNLPDLFTVELPIFKGTQKELIEVEFYASVSGREVYLQLVSPAANELLETLRDKVIDEQIEKIKSLTNQIVIIEQ